MRVTIVTRIFLPEPSAASFMLSAIAHELADAGHDVTVITSTPPRGTAINDPPGVRVRRFPVLRDRAGYVRGYLPYLSFDIPVAVRMLCSPADVYFVEPPPTTGAVVRIVAALLRRPYVYDAADIWSDAARNTTSSALVLGALRRLEVFAMRGARHIVTISQGVVDRFRELGVTAPASVAGFGADTSVFGYMPAVESIPAPYFIYAGSYSEWHGADVLLHAFAEFTAEHPGYRLLFVGNGSERGRLEALADTLALDAHIEFSEPVAAVELVPLLASAVASLASLRPGVGYDYAFTTKAYSSLAVGCPVIFTGPGPTIAFLTEAEEAQRSGVAVPFEPHAVAKAMAHFASSPLVPTERMKLAAWTAEHHSLAASARRSARAIADVAAPRR
jgi:glycosyltransferase involved in cell wall biosynthesis